MPNPNKYLLVVGGPTAAGKTSLAIALAQHYKTEIISADSRQFYQEMRIGNARPNEEELATVKHHLVADRSVTESLNAGSFAREAREILAQLYQTHDYAVVVGGSGLFLRSLTEGLDAFPEVLPAVRAKVEHLYQNQGLEGLQKELLTADPAYYEEVDLQNPVRLQRALEVCWSAGQPFSSFRTKTSSERSFTPIYLQPSWSREELYDRINQRVDLMLAAGLEEEVQRLADYADLPALQTVGYQEWSGFFKGKSSRETVIELIKQNSRRYAKRQLTWNRRDGYWKQIPRGDLRAALAYLELVTQEKVQLSTLAVDTEPPLLRKNELKKRVGLQAFVTDEIVAVADIIGLKEWALTKCWFGEAASHLAKTILLHEACHRSEKAVVYTPAGYLSADFLTANGWTKVATETLPRTLKEKLPNGEYWQWERSKQVF